MKVAGRTNADWAPFKELEAGTYNFVIAEGIKIWNNENTGKSSLYIPCKVADGDDIGTSLNLFFSMSKRGEQNVADLVECVGMGKKFADKFPGDASFFDDPVVAAMTNSLPGKYFTAVVELIVGKDKVSRATMTAIAPYGKMATSSTTATGKPAEATAAKEEEADW